MARLLTIDLEIERAIADKLLNEWRKAKAAKDAALVVASQTKSNPGDNYWQAEAKARAKWIVAANFVDMLEDAYRASEKQKPERGHARSGAGEVDARHPPVGG